MEAVIHDCKLFYRYEHSAEAEAPVVLLLHGWGCDGTIFAAFEKALLKKAAVLVVDFPGHGQSGEPLEPWGVPEYAEQIASLMDMLGVKQAHIIAHSFGGRVAIYLASHHPEKIGKMVITGGAGIRKPASKEQKKRQQQYKAIRTMLDCIGRINLFKGLVGRLQEKLRQKYGSADYNKLNENMRKTFVKVISQDLTEYLPSILSSTLLVWGDCDTETPLWMGQKMENLIPDAGLVVFEGRSHFAFIEEWQRFLTIVQAFFWEGNV